MCLCVFVCLVDVVLVLDHERLYNDLQKDLPGSVEVVPLSKSGGVSGSHDAPWLADLGLFSIPWVIHYQYWGYWHNVVWDIIYWTTLVSSL